MKRSLALLLLLLCFAVPAQSSGLESHELGPFGPVASEMAGDKYLSGDESTDGSVRLALGEDGKPVIQEKVAGIWQPGSLRTGSGTLWVGENVGVAGIGHHLATEASDGHLHFLGHSEFDGEL